MSGRQYKRIQPPVGMDVIAQKVWHMVVDSLPPEHFAKCDIPVLAMFCRHYVQHERAMAELESFPQITIIASNGAPGMHPMVGAVGKLSTTVAALATKLRIVPQARLATKEKASNPEFKGEKVTDGDDTDQLFLQ